MPKRLNILVVMLVALILGACQDDNSRVPPVRMDMVIAQIGDAGRLDVIKVDDGPELNVVKVKRSSLSAEANSLVRAIAYYEQNLDLKEAIVYDIANVSVVTPRINETTDLAKQYPVTFFRGWISAGFLNLELGIKAKDTKLHVIGFDEQSSDKPNTVCLMFTHDKGEDIDAATKRILLSIPLKYYDERFADEAYVINLKLNTFKGVDIKEFKR